MGGERLALLWAMGTRGPCPCPRGGQPEWACPLCGVRAKQGGGVVNFAGHSPLNEWLVRRMRAHGDAVASASGLPTPTDIRRWQLDRLRRTMVHARSSSPFLAKHLADVDVGRIRTMEDLRLVPCMTPEDVRREGDALLCVSRDEVARVVTLTSSGTTGKPKRVHHTAEDLEATCDYFRWGMAAMVGEGQTAFVLMPGDRPGGVGRLLCEALKRGGARAVLHGELTDSRAAVEHLLAEGARCVVGPSAHVNMLARQWRALDLPRDVVRTALLCWDVVPEAVVHNVSGAFGCGVFRHWGMIETGLGGAVECAHGGGLHLREPDVLLEIVDPVTLQPLPDGEFGEMVVSTPLRRGMPFIRYRTGDRGRILPGACGCGSPLRRLDPMVRRLDEAVTAAVPGAGSAVDYLSLGDLNEALYALDDVWDYSARLVGRTLRLSVCGEDGEGSEYGGRNEHGGLAGSVRSALDSVPAVRELVRSGRLELRIDTHPGAAPAVPGLAKRRLMPG